MVNPSGFIYFKIGHCVSHLLDIGTISRFEMVGIMPLLRRSDANSRPNVRPATGVPDHRAANSEKEATMTKQANDFRGRIFSREDIFARGYFREKIFSREDIFAGRYFREKIFSREDIFAGRYFRERIFSREDIFAGRYFRGKIFSREQ